MDWIKSLTYRYFNHQIPSLLSKAHLYVWAEARGCPAASIEVTISVCGHSWRCTWALHYLRLQACVDTPDIVHGHWAIWGYRPVWHSWRCTWALGDLKSSCLFTEPSPSFSNTPPYLLKVYTEMLSSQNGFMVIQGRKVCGKWGLYRVWKVSMLDEELETGYYFLH